METEFEALPRDSGDMMSLYIIITRWHLGEISNFQLLLPFILDIMQHMDKNRFLILRLDMIYYLRETINILENCIPGAFLFIFD